MTTDKNTAEIVQLVRRLKTGEQLTDAERQRLENYRQQIATAASDELLITLAAKTDALLQPHRLEPDRQGPVAQRIFDYWRTGLRWNIGGSEAVRKAGERELAALENRGAVQCHRQRGRATRIKLTPSAYLDVRAKCGLPSVFETLTVICRMKALAEAGRFVPGDDAMLTDDPNTDRQYCREFDLCEPPFELPKSGPRPLAVSERESLFQLQETLSPAFFLGWANWATHHTHLIGYAASGTVDPQAAIFKTELPTLNLDDAEKYTAAWEAERAALKAAAPLWKNDIGLFPFFTDFRTVAERKPLKFPTGHDARLKKQNQAGKLPAQPPGNRRRTENMTHKYQHRTGDAPAGAVTLQRPQQNAGAKPTMREMQKFVAAKSNQKNSLPPGNRQPAVLPPPPQPETPPEKAIGFGEIIKAHDGQLYGANQVLPGATGRPPCADCDSKITQTPGGIQWFRWTATMHQPLCPNCARKVGLVTTEASQPRTSWPVGESN